MPKKIKVATGKCSGCGDNLIFSPKHECLFCPACNSKVEIDSKFGITKNKYNDSVEISNHNSQKWASENKIMQCPNCGATSILHEYQKSTSCSYCNTSLVASHENFEGLKPDTIIPFAFDKDKAQEIFQNNIKGKWLVPSSLKQSLKADEVHAFYFPTFVFDAESDNTYKARLYRNETITDSNGNEETEKKYFNIEGVFKSYHKNISVEASTHLTQQELNSIKPYDFNKAKTYSDEFIYGFSIEHYSSSLKDCNLQAHDIMKRQTQKLILENENYDGIDSFEMVSKFSNEKYSYCVLPLYRINFKHKDKQYSNIINGQTGKVSGNYPKSAGKIGLITLLVLLFICVPFILVFLISLLH